MGSMIMLKVKLKINEVIFVVTILLSIIILTYVAEKTASITVFIISILFIIWFTELYNKYDGIGLNEGKLLLLLAVGAFMVQLVILRSIQIIIIFMYNLFLMIISLAYLFIILKTMSVKVDGNDVVIQFDVIPLKLSRVKHINNDTKTSMVSDDVRGEE